MRHTTLREDIMTIIIMVLMTTICTAGCEQHKYEKHIVRIDTVNVKTREPLDILNYKNLSRYYEVKIEYTHLMNKEWDESQWHNMNVSTKYYESIVKPMEDSIDKGVYFKQLDTIWSK